MGTRKMGNAAASFAWGAPVCSSPSSFWKCTFPCLETMKVRPSRLGAPAFGACPAPAQGTCAGYPPELAESCFGAPPLRLMQSQRCAPCRTPESQTHFPPSVSSLLPSWSTARISSNGICIWSAMRRFAFSAVSLRRRRHSAEVPQKQVTATEIIFRDC